jgi:hypothetical protein
VIGVAVAVDEPGADDPALRIDYTLAARVQFPHGGYQIAYYAHIGPNGGRTAPIDHQTVFNDDIEHR